LTREWVILGEPGIGRDLGIVTPLLGVAPPVRGVEGKDSDSAPTRRDNDGEAVRKTVVVFPNRNVP